MLGTLCRELDWSRSRLLYELRQGRVPYRTIPPGHVIDWHDPNVEHSLDVKASTVTLVLGVLDVPGVIGLDCITVGVEVLLPTDDLSPPVAAPRHAGGRPAEHDWESAAAHVAERKRGRK